MYLDIGFEILIPAEAKNPAVSFEQPSYEWQGVRYAQGPEQALVGYFKLIKTAVPEHILSFLPESFKKDNWQCISIINGLEELSLELHLEDETVKKGDGLIRLLQSIVGNETKWAINFTPGYDPIVSIMEGNVDLVFQKIVESLKAERIGFLIWFDKNY